jgi:endo-1,4-beta-xylanase
VTLRCALLAGLLVLAGCGGADEPPREPFPEGAGAAIERPEVDVPLGTAVTWSVLSGDAELQTAIERAFDSVTPENEMKWELVEPERGELRYDDADALVAWARERGKRVRGHTLVWHQQIPGWVADVDRDELESVLVEHVKEVAGHFRGKVDSWDVVNEPFTDAGEWRSDKGFPFLDALGPGYVEVALRAARAADPDAKLFVNEIGAESGGPKLEALKRMVRDLEARGVPLDGIGLESHHEAGKAPSRERVEQTIRELVALGVDVEITELDIEDTGAGPEAQAQGYRDTAAACAAVRRCRRLTVWGVSDRDSWLGVESRPLPFDTALRPKPAWDALVEALRR